MPCDPEDQIVAEVSVAYGNVIKSLWRAAQSKNYSPESLCKGNHSSSNKHSQLRIIS